jgi:hypothetical protein
MNDGYQGVLIGRAGNLFRSGNRGHLPSSPQQGGHQRN